MLYKIYYVISLDVLKTQAKKNLKHNPIGTQMLGGEYSTISGILGN